MAETQEPIAVFDSGVGGLTVVAALRAALPRETIYYLGDTARLPYGTKSAAVVERYAVACAEFLRSKGVKAMVVACNTASAHALAHLRASLPLPVVGVIEPGATAAAARSRSGRIGVLGTEGTIQSGSYQRAIMRDAPGAQVFATACPLLVPLAEEGLIWHPATRLLAQDYLAPLLAERIDTLVLGCTHYPLLQPLLQELCGPGVAIVNSAAAVAEALAQLLHDAALASTQRGGADRFFATDVSERLRRIGRAFLGDEMGEVELVDIAVAPARGAAT